MKKVGFQIEAKSIPHPRTVGAEILLQPWVRHVLPNVSNCELVFINRLNNLRPFVSL